MAVVGWKVLWVLSICVLMSDALFFHISETETKCFIEEVPDETLIVGGYSHWGAFSCRVVCLDGVPLHHQQRRVNWSLFLYALLCVSLLTFRQVQDTVARRE